MIRTAFLQKVITDCSSFTEGMNESITNGAALASDILATYLSEYVDRVAVINAITRIADRTTSRHYNLDFKMGMTYFIDSISHIAFLNDLIDPLEYWSFVSMISTLRLSYISQF